MGLNVFEIRGHGRQGGISLVGRSGSYRVDLLPKIQVNIILSEQKPGRRHRDHPQGCLYRGGRDGLIFVLPVEEVIRSAPGSGATTR